MNDEDHRFPDARRDFIKRLPPADYDAVDIEVAELAASDPLLDRLPKRRHTRGAGRLFAILDELERGGNH